MIQDAAGTQLNIVVDFWMHQWWKADTLLNQEIDEKVTEADYIFITHAHLDHIWRLPMLVSRGFKGKIIMTPATKELAFLSLEDSAKIMETEYQAKVEERKRKWKIASDISRYTSFENQQTLTPEEDVRKNEIERKYWVEAIKKIQDRLTSVDGDISKVLPEIPKPLYSLEDVYTLFSRYPKDVRDHWERNNAINPEEDERNIKRDHSQFFDNNTIDVTQWEDKKQLETPTSFIETHEFCESISLVCSKKGKKLDGTTLSIQDIAVQFLPAGHILWSAQLEVKIWVERVLKWAQVDVAYSRKEQETYRLLFWGDMGRFDAGNNLWSPKLPSWEYLYREMEGTYANRHHPERNQAIEQLFSTLKSAGKHILLPNFSLQRSPDMLLLLLDYIEQVCIPESDILKYKNKSLKSHIRNCRKTLLGTDSQELRSQLEQEIQTSETEMKENGERIDVLDTVIISDSTLFQKTLPIYISEKPEIYEALSEEAQKKRFRGQVVIKYLPPNESKKFFERYKAWVWKKAQDRRTKIIVSSWGMCEWGAVVGHLQRMAPQPNADIIFTGYAPPTSLAWKLKWEDEQVIIEGTIYDVNARIHDITGFSWHAWKDELVMWHNAAKVTKWWIDAIVHGWDARFVLAHELGKSHKRAWIVCPELWETIKIPFPYKK